MKVLLLFTCAMLAAGRVTAAEEPVNPDEKGIFDFSELDVPKEEEKKAQEKLEKDDLKADATLPADVRRMLDRLTVFEVVEKSVLAKRIQPLRTALKDKLLALSDKESGQGQIDLIALAKYVEGLAAEEELRPGAITLTADTGEGAGAWYYEGKHWGEFRPDGRKSGGMWRWLNRRHTILVAEFPERNHLDVLFLKSSTALEGTALNNQGVRLQVTRKSATAAAGRKPGPGGMHHVAETAKAEAALRAQATGEIAKRRTGVGRWLIQQAKAAPPAAAMKVLAEANSLNPQTNGKPSEQSGKFAGIWIMEDRSKLEFRSDGNVAISGKTGQATWLLANLRSRATAFILFGKPDDPADIWVARISNDDPGVVRVYSRDKATSARLQ